MQGVKKVCFYLHYLEKDFLGNVIIYYNVKLYHTFVPLQYTLPLLCLRANVPSH